MSDVRFDSEEAVDKRVNIVLVCHMTYTWVVMVTFPFCAIF